MNEWGATGFPFFFLVDFELTNAQVYSLDNLDSDIYFDIEGYRNFDSYQKDEPLGIKILSLSPKEYQAAFKNVKNEIRKGNSYLINLTWRHQIDCGAATLMEIFFASRSKYRLYFKDKFVVFSPETFVKITDGEISSYPMKGTIDADIPNASYRILNDAKERAEHNTIVDLIRNDLSKVAKEVKVDNFRYIERIQSSKKNLLQVSSKITGKLRSNYEEKLGDIFFSLLPAGSISGAPKKKTIQIIKFAEKYRRGYYTGVCGIFDGQNLNSFVMIRFIEKKDGEFFYFSGGGVTSMSEVHKEYQEMLDKIYVPTS